MTRYLLPLLLSLGCASADGSPHPPPEEPSPEAQQEPSQVCEDAPGFVAWESNGLVHVSKREGATAVIQHYDRTPPFFDVFGDVPMFVSADLSVCLL